MVKESCVSFFFDRRCRLRFDLGSPSSGADRQVFHAHSTRPNRRLGDVIALPAGSYVQGSRCRLDDRCTCVLTWDTAVFELYLAEEKIESEVVENMRSWEHSGFSVDQSVFLPAGDQAGIERLIQYMTRCPFSLSRLVKVSDTGQVVYQAEKQACRAFPDPKGDGTQAGVKRNFQILSPLDFLAEFTQHIPPKGSHLIRYYGWYSNKSRGMRKKAEAEASGRVIERRGRRDGQQPILGDVDQAGVRSGPLVLSGVWRPDAGGVVHRTASGRRDRSDPQALRFVAVAVTEGTTGGG